MKAAILQPMYLPWIGVFGLIDSCDCFIFYDDVQFVKSSWQCRNKVKVTKDTTAWLTVPINAKFGTVIKDAVIDNTKFWKTKHWKTLEACYGGADYFEDYNEEISEIYKEEWTSLCKLNIFIIKKLVKILNIKIPAFICSSDIGYNEYSKTDRLVHLLKKVNATEYISGPAAKDYIEMNKFQNANIKLSWFEYNHPFYPQRFGDFISHLSIIDLLFNTGLESIDYIRKGLENAINLDKSFTSDEIKTK